MNTLNEILIIQRAWYNYNLRKWKNKLINLKLEKKANNYTFDKFCEIIKKKKIILCTKIFLLKLSKIYKDLNISPKIFLTAYLIKFYPDNLFSNEKFHIDKEIIKLSNLLITELYQDFNIKSFYLLCFNFNLIFKQWKEFDKNKLVESLIVSYYQKKQYLIKINDSNNIENKEKVIYEINNQLNDILINLKIVQPQFDIEYLTKNYQLVFNSIFTGKQKIFNQISNCMKLTYHDFLMDSIKENNNEPIYQLFIEIRNKLLKLAPNNVITILNQECNENKLNFLLERYIDDVEIEIKYLITLYIEIVISLDAPINDNNNLIWKNKLFSKFENKLSDKLPFILISISEMIDSILFQINKLIN